MDPNGTTVYVAQGLMGLAVWDITTPTSPTKSGFFSYRGNISYIFLNGEYLWMADPFTGIRALDVSNPKTVLAGDRLDYTGHMHSMSVSPDSRYLFVADESTDFVMYDISMPFMPVRVDRLKGGMYDIYIN
jgi:hypothetical protein